MIWGSHHLWKHPYQCTGNIKRDRGGTYDILIQAAKAQELTTHPRSRPAPSGPVVVAFFMLGVWAMGHDVWSAIPGTPKQPFF